MIILRHPSLRQLRAFAAGETEPGSRRAATARHLEHCARCRERVAWMRAVVAAAAEPSPAPAGSFETIRERIEHGQRVLLPDPSAVPGAVRARTRVHGSLAAAGLAALVAAGFLLLRTPEAGAEKSELWIDPAAPTAGATITLRYRATARLSGEERLVVRTRYYLPGQAGATRTVSLGELRRTGANRYTGRITLPDSAVYAVLAIEDVDASFVDDHGERWDIMVHDDGGQPLFDALRKRYYDVRRRNTLLAGDVLREMVRLYPDEPGGWYFLHAEVTADVARGEIEMVRTPFRTELRRLEAAAEADLDSLTEEHLWYLAMFAGGLGDTDARDRWRAVLIDRYPTSGSALQQASWIAASRHRDDPPALLAALDSLWALAPEAAVQIAFDGMNAAIQTGTPEVILRWTDRFDALRPDHAPWHGIRLIEHAATREAGMARLRAGLVQLEHDVAERSLTHTAADHDEAQHRIAGQYLAALGRALLDAGRTGAALDTLDRALGSGWNPALFRALGDARLEHGDTAGALEAFARFAADPNTAMTFADSLRARLAERHNRANTDPLGPDWESRVEAAWNELRRVLFETSLNRAPLRPRLRLRDPAGRAHEVSLDASGPTVVAFWSRYCPPSNADLEPLDRVAARIIERGVRFFAITDQADGAAVATFAEERNLTMPIFLDPQRDAHNAFDNRGTPFYVVLGKDGRIRFTSRRADDVARHVAVLDDAHR